MRIARLQSRPITRRPAALMALAAMTAAMLLVLAQPAHATSIGEKIILRCTGGESLSGFSQSDYQQALKDLNGDVEEYNPECSSEIHQAELAAAAGARGGASVASGQTGAAPVALAATPSERQAIAHAESASPESVKLGGAVIHAGVVHADIASALSSLPTPLLAILAFLLACLLAVGGGALRKRVRR
jgi:hypothetical protein